MKLEQQVCSLELAKRLKELGVKQESIVSWQLFRGWGDHEDKWEVRHYSDFQPTTDNGDDVCCAFTVAELGEMLPTSVQIKNELLLLEVCKRFDRDNKGTWMVDYLDKDGHLNGILGYSDHSEADARAKMLIYLLENKLTTLQ